ncbi:Smr/MutS family protein [Geomonas sp.]|uniref:Smr/MutS family protein n=1 Tax=Geomonas sp. TaxID=2651584 RepID=UPI002B46D98D|nr:Smr/MutS family protein [Geomonas sp.]HJV34895.1 Smr/MutS family protein [Geomonas sp.]
MKKKEKPKPKEKEFSVSPFKALKGVALAGGDQQKESAGKSGAPQGKSAASSARQPAPKAKQAAPAKPAKTREEMEEDLLFFEAMAGVQRIGSAPPPPAQVKAQAEARGQRNAEDDQLFMKAIEALKIDVRFADQLPEQDERPHPVPVNRLRQVRRGTIRIDLQLDLHGLTKDEALENLDRFVRGAYNRGQKGVLVITGKGNNSPGEPVLKAAVAGWLRETGKGMVSEFVQAPQDMGGEGAVVVFLKEKKAEPEPAA